MRKPTCRDFDNGDSTCDYDGYQDAMDDYADAAYDEYRDREMEEKLEKESETNAITELSDILKTVLFGEEEEFTSAAKLILQQIEVGNIQGVTMKGERDEHTIKNTDKTKSAKESV